MLQNEYIFDDILTHFRIIVKVESSVVTVNVQTPKGFVRHNIGVICDGVFYTVFAYHGSSHFKLIKRLLKLNPHLAETSLHDTPLESLVDINPKFYVA